MICLKYKCNHVTLCLSSFSGSLGILGKSNVPPHSTSWVGLFNFQIHLSSLSLSKTVFCHSKIIAISQTNHILYCISSLEHAFPSVWNPLLCLVIPAGTSRPVFLAHLPSLFIYYFFCHTSLTSLPAPFHELAPPSTVTPRHFIHGNCWPCLLSNLLPILWRL